MILYVEAINNNNDIINISTVDRWNPCIKAEFLDSAFYFDKMQGYKLISENGYDYKLIFDQDKYNLYLETKRKEESLKEANILLEDLKYNSVLKSATDDEAYIMRYLYSKWKPDTDYKIGDRVLNGDELCKCKKDHTSKVDTTINTLQLDAATSILPEDLWEIIKPITKQK